MKRVCVFCGSSPGSGPAYLEAARRLGQELVERGIGLVYGGAGVGLMGRLASTVLSGGGEVIGVIPRSLMEREVAMSNLPDLRVVPSMHERKFLMSELSDGFIALPGGLGTLEELLEALTWTQLGIHEKPCGVLNVAGYFDHLVRFLLHAEQQHFIRPEHRSMLIAHDDPKTLVDLLDSYQHPHVDKAEWIRSLSSGASA